jgi:hypothetical protein
MVVVVHIHCCPFIVTDAPLFVDTLFIMQLLITSPVFRQHFQQSRPFSQVASLRMVLHATINKFVTGCDHKSQFPPVHNWQRNNGRRQFGVSGFSLQ